MAKDRVIRISAEITPTLGNMNEVVSKVRTTLQSGISTIDFTKGAGKDLSKLLDTFSQKYSDFQRLTKDGVFRVEDSKTVLKTGEQLVSTFNELRRIVGDFGSLQVLDAKKLFPQAFDSRVSDLSSALEKLTDNFLKLNSKKVDLSNKEKDLDTLNNKIATLEAKLKDPEQLEIETKNAEKALDKANNKVTKLKQNLKKTVEEELSGINSELEEKRKTLTATQTRLSSNKNLHTGAGGQTFYLAKPERGWQADKTYTDKGKSKRITKEKREEVLGLIEQYNKDKEEEKNLKNSIKELENRQKLFSEVYKNIEKSPSKATSDMKATVGVEVKEYEKLEKATEEATEAKENFDKVSGEEKANSANIEKLDKLRERTNNVTATIEKLKQEILGLDQNTDFTKISEAYEKLTGQNLDQNLLKTEAGIKQINDQLIALDNDSLEKLKQNLLQAGLGADQAEGFISKFRKGVDDAGHSVKEFTDHEKEVESFRQRLLQFFSIGNSVRLFQRAIRSAFETVKELDSAITEIAVVSDFSISDMWARLPEFTAQANELGVAIKDTYEATTLFVQQGLDLQNSMKLSSETLKMARIAGMGAADATDAITSALRGFNMELNELSAQRINDVYSEIAAISASDVQELSTAMSKVASLAHNLGMEFETTTAFLGQMIETTREAPEVAGTALKTVAARFAEVKDLYSKGEILGSDEEGQEINVNNIQKALRSVGISMTDFLVGNEGLDQVLLRLAEKWDTIDTATKRYIATMAAGSRQQSRFMALLSDYDRTVELVDAAYDSAGAGQAQYEKTLESLQTKLAKLKNAWDEFLMGLSNNNVLKGAVDLLTGFLTTINKLISSLSGNSGTLKTILSFLTVAGGFKLGKSILGSTGFGSNGLLGSLFGKKSDVEKAGAASGESFFKGFAKAANKGSFLKDALLKKDLVIDLSQNLQREFKTTDWNFDFSRANPTGLENFGKTISNQLSAGSTEYQALGEEFSSLWKTKDYNGAINALNKFGVSIKMTGQEAKDMGVSISKASVNFKSLEAGAALTATSLMGLAAVLDDAGFEDISVVIRSLGTALLGTIPIIQMVEAAMASGAATISEAIYSIPIIGWISAIVSVLIALIQLLSHFSSKYGEVSPEEKLEDLKDATDEAKKSAEEARKEYDKLLSSRTDYQDKVDALDKLTQGTTAWKESLIEANQAVLELLQTYPELADGDYVTQSSNGRLQVSDEFWSKQSELAYQKLKESTAMTFAAQANQLGGQRNLSYGTISGQLSKVTQNYYSDEQYNQLIDNLSEKLAEGGVEAFRNAFRTNYISWADFDNLSEEERAKIQSGTASQNDYGITYYSDEALSALGDFSKDIDGLSPVIVGLTDKFEQLRASTPTIENSQANANRQAIEGLMDSSLVANGGSDFAQIIANNLSGEAFDSALAKELGLVDSAAGNVGARFSELAKQYGITIVGDATKDALSLYEAMYQQSAPEGRGDDKDWLLNQIALKSVYSQMADDAEVLTKAMGKLDKQTQISIGGILTNGEGLNKLGLDNVLGNLNFYLDQLAEKAGVSGDELAKLLGYESYDAMSGAFQTNLGNTQKDWQNTTFDAVQGAKNAMSATMLAQALQNAGLSLSQYKSVLGTYSTIGAKDQSGEAQQLFAQVISSLLNNAESEASKKQITNLLGAYNLSDYNEVQQFLQELGDTGLVTTEDINTLETALIDLGKATMKVDLSKLTEQTQTLLDLADDISSRNRSDGITSDELDTLVSAGVAKSSDFFFTGQEFIPIETSMDTLAENIRANTEAVLKNTMAQLQQQIREGEQFSSAVDAARASGNLTNAELESLDKILSGETATVNDASVIKKLMDSSNPDSITNAEALQWFNAMIDSYMSLPDLKSQANDLGYNMMQASAYQMGPQALLDSINSGELVTKTNDSLAGTGVNIDEEAVESLLADQVKIAGLVNAVDDLTDGFRASGGEIEDNSNLLRAHSLQIDKDEKKIKTLCETVNDVKDAFLLENDAVLAGAVGSEDYRNALEKIEQKGQEVFGDSFTSDFIQANAELVSQLAEGGDVGEQAFLKIQEAMRNSVLTSEDFINKLGGDINSFLADVNNAEALIKVNGVADVSDIINKLMQVGYSAEEAVAILEKLSGISITIGSNVTYKPVNMPKAMAEKMGLDYQGYSGSPMVTALVPEIEIASAAASKKSYGGSGYSGGSSGSGGGGSSKDKLWENPYDELYNLTEKINEALRQREKLEREYDRILERRGSTFKELRANYNAQLASLEKEIEYQKELQAGRKRQLDNLANEKHADSDGNRKTYAQWGVTQYASYDQALGIIRIDWNAIDKVTDEEKGGAIEAYISRLEELQEQFEDTQKTIEDMQDTVEGLRKDQMSEYLDFEQSVYDALVNQQQKLIDEYQDISDKLAESNTEILDSLQESIDLQRQIRDNTKTEQDINEKEARLAYLRRDTSNANLLEIKQLEEELADSRQSYGDTLVDQQLSRLTKQSEDAQKAREKQIELMQAQLDYASENGEFWNQAYELIQSGFSADGSLNQASQLWTLLQEDQGWNGLSKFGQLNWQEEISKAIIAASQGYANWNMYKAEQVDKSLILPDGTKLTFDGKKWRDSQGNVYNGVDFDSNANQFKYGSIDYAQPSGGGSGSSGDQSPAKQTVSVGSRFNASGALIYTTPGGKGYRQYFADEPYYVAVGESGDYWLARWYKASGGVSGYFRKGDVKAYKSGGLADSTGPAWLDGTYSKPELILNAQDTKNFIQLKDILSSFMNSSSTQSGFGGTSYYDIDINVEEIGNDYDVDRLAERVKEQINSESRYRNVNSISFLR